MENKHDRRDAVNGMRGAECRAWELGCNGRLVWAAWAVGLGRLGRLDRRPAGLWALGSGMGWAGWALT